MNLYDAIQILRLHNQYFRCPAHIPDDARPPLVDAWALAEAIDVVLSELHAASESALIYASTQAQLQVELAEALKKVAQSLEWHAHGSCRGFDDGAPLPTGEAVELAKRTIAKVRA